MDTSITIHWWRKKNFERVYFYITTQFSGNRVVHTRKSRWPLFDRLIDYWLGHTILNRYFYSTHFIPYGLLPQQIAFPCRISVPAPQDSWRGSRRCAALPAPVRYTVHYIKAGMVRVSVLLYIVIGYRYSASSTIWLDIKFSIQISPDICIFGIHPNRG